MAESNLIVCTKDELSALIKMQFDNFKENFKPQQEVELLETDEACAFLKIHRSTLHRFVKAGKISVYGKGAKRYYKKQELLDCLIKLKN